MLWSRKEPAVISDAKVLVKIALAPPASAEPTAGRPTPEAGSRQPTKEWKTSRRLPCVGLAKEGFRLRTNRRPRSCPQLPPTPSPKSGHSVNLPPQPRFKVADACTASSYSKAPSNTDATPSDSPTILARVLPLTMPEKTRRRSKASPGTWSATSRSPRSAKDYIALSPA